MRRVFWLCLGCLSFFSASAFAWSLLPTFPPTASPTITCTPSPSATATAQPTISPTTTPTAPAPTATPTTTPGPGTYCINLFLSDKGGFFYYRAQLCGDCTAIDLKCIEAKDIDGNCHSCDETSSCYGHLFDDCVKI